MKAPYADARHAGAASKPESLTMRRATGSDARPDHGQGRADSQLTFRSGVLRASAVSWLACALGMMCCAIPVMIGLRLLVP
eukprot:3174405-Rhodomonas_salina.1